MTTELVTVSTSLDYSRKETIDTLKQTVAAGATDAEMKMFIELCKASRLNPFKREVWFIKVRDRVQIMTGINGFFAIANSHPQFDGHESGLITPTGAFASSAYAKEDFIGAWAKVYRKDRRVPTEGIAMLIDYDKKQSNWLSMKRVMIVKCAESIALRKTFPQEMNGLYTQEEMPAEYSIKAAIAEADPLTSNSHRFLGQPEPVAKDELETYIVQHSPAAEEINNLMLCEIDPEFFERLVAGDPIKDVIDKRDLVNLQQYYMKFIRVGHKTKAEQ